MTTKTKITLFACAVLVILGYLTLSAKRTAMPEEQSKSAPPVVESPAPTPEASPSENSEKGPAVPTPSTSPVATAATPPATWDPRSILDAKFNEKGQRQYSEIQDLSSRLTQEMDQNRGTTTEAQSEIMRVQAELMLDAQTGEGEATATRDVLAKCGVDSSLLADVRVICAANLKRLARQYPDLVQKQYQTVLENQTTEELEWTQDLSRELDQQQSP